MGDAVIELLIGVLSNLLFTAILGVGAVALSKAIWRRELRDFFGVSDPKAGAIKIRLSSMNVKPGGTTGTVLINRGYCGPAISEIEYKYALLLAGAIETKPITRMLRHLIEPVARVESPLICDIGASMPFNGEPPVDFDAMSGLVAKIEKELSSGTSILVGGPVYNLLTSYIFGRPGSRCQFIVERDELRRGISIKVSPGTEARDFVRQSPEQNQAGAYTEYCLLEKLAGPQGSTVFVCAGTGAGATIAALTQLQHWKKLPNRLKRAPEFFILYEATAQTRIKSHPS